MCQGARGKGDLAKREDGTEPGKREQEQAEEQALR